MIPMTMANTENTREKKTMRKRARPLRGARGAVTEGAREEQVSTKDPACWEGPPNKLSPILTPISGDRARTLSFQMPQSEHEAASSCSSGPCRRVTSRCQCSVFLKGGQRGGGPESRGRRLPQNPHRAAPPPLWASPQGPQGPCAHSQAASCCPPRARTRLDAASPLLGS